MGGTSTSGDLPLERGTLKQGTLEQGTLEQGARILLIRREPERPTPLIHEPREDLSHLAVLNPSVRLPQSKMTSSHQLPSTTTILSDRRIFNLAKATVHPIHLVEDDQGRSWSDYSFHRDSSVPRSAEIPQCVLQARSRGVL